MGKPRTPEEQRLLLARYLVRDEVQVAQRRVKNWKENIANGWRGEEMLDRAVRQLDAWRLVQDLLP